MLRMAVDLRLGLSSMRPVGSRHIAHLLIRVVVQGVVDRGDWRRLSVGHGRNGCAMFEMSHVLGALLASSPLLAQAWTRCLRANASSANFVIDRSDDAIFVAFSGVQAAASPSGLNRGFFKPVSLYSGTHELFAPLGRALCVGCINSIGWGDIKHLKLEWLRSQIGLVTQEPTLLSLSIKDNIAYGRSATSDQIEEAAKTIHAHDFITSLEMGYETQVDLAHV
ncbi:hypothetical protein ZIOFF_060207 [Zingiber officinale]|uniref:ABC transporter domain-containing protein n=1 Tax=Zingiber officinale TaxID=94328 RepID=A0A8J5KKW1_ZINOF|nr:hypothetical protein ZIOFF_060207 [Zingiber officinale]